MDKKFGLPDKGIDFKSFEGKIIYFRHRERDYLGRLDRVDSGNIIVSELLTGKAGKKSIEPLIVDNVVLDLGCVSMMHESSREERDNAIKLKYPYNKYLGEYVCILSDGNSFYGILDVINTDGFELKPTLVRDTLEYGSVLKLEERLPVFIRPASRLDIIPSSKGELEKLIEISKRNYKLQEKEAKMKQRKDLKNFKNNHTSLLKVRR